MMLYFRMILTLLVSLYTSRVVLNALGIEDFGIYNVVGGVVLMFEFLNGAMTSATQRFLSYEIGKKDFNELKRVFSMSINIHILIAVLIIFLAETFGLWFVKSQLTIPKERMDAAIWVYQFAIFSFVATIIRVPYNASIIANEKMQAFAIISIIDATLKLLVVFMLVWFDYDKLRLYAILTFIIILMISVIYQQYCKHIFPHLKFQKCWHKGLFMNMFSFAGWNLWSNISYVGFTTGINILLNIFFGPSINAARGIAYQVNAAINNFVTNFRVAINPQIIKSYAKNEINYMIRLVYISSKFSYFLLFVLSLPLFIEIDIILKWWLNIVPDYTALFCRLILINSLIDCIAAPLTTSAQATGKIKRYHFATGTLYLSILPISYILLKSGLPPQTTHFVNIFISIIVLMLQIYMIAKLVVFSKIEFLKQVIIPIFFVSALASIMPLFAHSLIDSGLIRFICVSTISILSSLMAIYVVGINMEERHFIIEKLTGILHKYRK